MDETPEERGKRILRTPFAGLSRAERIELTIRLDAPRGLVTYVVKPVDERRIEIYGMAAQGLRPVGWDDDWSDPSKIKWQVGVPVAEFRQHAEQADEDIRPILLQAVDKLAAKMEQATQEGYEVPRGQANG